MKRLLSAALAAVLLSAPLPAAALELEDAKALLCQYYLEGVPEQVLALDSLDAILEALGDPYTYYMDGSQHEAYDQAVNGQVSVGVGMTVSGAYDGGFPILSVTDGSPAMEAGVLPGDRLVAVDGQEVTAQFPLSSLASGPEGSTLEITVIRDGERLTFSLVRRSMTRPIVTYALKDGAAYIDCDSFGSSTAQVFQQALTQLDGETAVWLVDLRQNPGGNSLTCAQSVGLFTGGGPVLYLRDREGRYEDQVLSPLYPDLTDKPAILLTDSESASASELFAAAIRDRGAGVALGQRTYGKGSAQVVLDESSHPALFSGGEALRITAYRFFSPGGATNHVLGVIPTLVLSPENTLPAAALLSCPAPDRAEGHLLLELAGEGFYLDLDQAMGGENRTAFTELLEALPPSALLYRGYGADRWELTGGQELAQTLGLDFRSRRYPGSEGSAYQRELDTLAAYQLLPNLGEQFQPQQVMTRAEFATLLCVALNLYAGQEGQFADVPTGSYYAQPINAVASMGFLSGSNRDTFAPGDPITCQQAAACLSAVAAWASMEGYELAQEELSVGQWLDYSGYAPWAQVPARNMDQLGVLPEGLSPDDSLSREAACAMVCRLMEGLGLLWD